VNRYTSIGLNEEIPISDSDKSKKFLETSLLAPTVGNSVATDNGEDEGDGDGVEVSWMGTNVLLIKAPVGTPTGPRVSSEVVVVVGESVFAEVDDIVGTTLPPELDGMVVADLGASV
jgi:hypothetical protein